MLSGGGARSPPLAGPTPERSNWTEEIGDIARAALGWTGLDGPGLGGLPMGLGLLFNNVFDLPLRVGVGGLPVALGIGDKGVGRPGKPNAATSDGRPALCDGDDVVILFGFTLTGAGAPTPFRCKSV